MPSRATALFVVIVASALVFVGAFKAGFLPGPFGMFNEDSQQAFRVVLDPGHGGPGETGAVGYGLIERDSNLDMAKRVGALLTADGIEVIYTRTDGGRAIGDTSDLYGYSAIFADIDHRIAIANEAEADLFISIHSNGYQDPSVRGLEMIYNTDRPFAARNRELAEAIMGSVVGTLEARGYVLPPTLIREDTAMIDAAGRTSPFLVLGPQRELSRDEMDERGGDWDALGFGARSAIQTRATEMPGVLLELLYITNEEDAALLQDDSVRHYMAMGIAEGIKSVLRSEALPEPTPTAVAP